jgi:hypothetical protein
MPQYNLRVNGGPVTVDSWDPDQPLLYILRNTRRRRAPLQLGAFRTGPDGGAARSTSACYGPTFSQLTEKLVLAIKLEGFAMTVVPAG